MVYCSSTKLCMYINGKHYESVENIGTPMHLSHHTLIMSSTMDLQTQQEEYTQAFPKAMLDDLIFFPVPQGWFVHNGVLCNMMIHVTMTLHFNYTKEKLVWSKASST